MGVLGAEVWDETSSSTMLRWGFRLMGEAGSARGHGALGPRMMPAAAAFTPAGTTAETVEPAGPAYIPPAFAAYFHASLAAVRGEAPCPTTGADKLRALRLAFAVRAAAAAGPWIRQG